MRARTLVTSLAFLAWGATMATVSAAPPQLPAKYTNLQVLSKDITQQELIAVMRGAAIGLGVRCWYCHEGTGDDFSTFNFAADTKEPKATARAMMKMTTQINAMLKDVGPHKGEAAKVTCQTCHRGSTAPIK